MPVIKTRGGRKVDATHPEIAPKIRVIRGQRVMLDSDLAELYGVATKVLNQAVRRNIRRFPDDFMFRLTEEEADSLRSQIVTLKEPGRGEHRKYLPLAFTEQGVAMLSGVLSSERAVTVNIAIMRAFVVLRRAAASIVALSRRLDEISAQYDAHDEKIQAIFAALRQLMTPPPDDPKRRIGF